MFGESQSRIVISLPKHNLQEIEDIANEFKVPIKQIGKVGGEYINFGSGTVSLLLCDAKDAWENGFSRATAD